MINELDVNMNLFKLTSFLDEVNILDYIKIISVKYGVPYTKVAKLLGISKQRLSNYISSGQVGMMDETKVKEWVLILKAYFAK
ncbi:hypothetical protein [Clostridium polynesiense]|uniref:hypothetical protein n=1 Tax=Clostridium polynesiense TaxID=1325933 RepID=UPI00058D8BDD|nr:hypothetical protein [Clostridium polynesiense]